MNTTVEEKDENKSGLVAGSSTVHVELTDIDGNSSVDTFNGQKCYIFTEHGNLITLGFKIPEDESAPAFVYSLMLGGNIETVKSHRTNSDGVVYLTIKHDIQMVSDWSIGGGMLQVKFLTESSVVINANISIEGEASDSSN